MRRLLGAGFKTLTGGMKQGGSTLTQQLVKNLYLSPERTIRRKATEAVMAVILDARYSKDEILEAYLNEIYLGQRGSLAIRGVGAATRAYFAKEAHQLTPGEAALLAGMVRAGEISARELVTCVLERIERIDPQINAFRVVFAEQALNRVTRASF